MPGRRNQGRGGQGGRGGRSAQQTGQGSQGKKAKQKRQYHPHNLEFTHGQVTVYLLEAIALNSLDYTQDAIVSVQNMAHVDFAALRGNQTVYKLGKNNTKFHKNMRQAQLDRNWENLNNKIDKQEVIYNTNKYTVAAIITKHFITSAMRDTLSTEADWQDLQEDHVKLLKRMKTFMTVTDETSGNILDSWNLSRDSQTLLRSKMSLLMITEDGSKPKLIKCSRSLGLASEKKVS